MRVVCCLLIIIVASSLHPAAAAAPDCDALFAAQRESALKLSYEEFDQTEGRGMRALAREGCEKQAADLIELYIDTHHSEERSLTWHVAQLRATAGDYPAAISNARLVLSESEDFSKNALRWNDYVLATIAFLERDKARLLHHRDQVAAASDAHFGNKLNTKLLDSLIRHFERDYKYATGHIAKD